ncbi:MAG TPA: sigma 54-interacting transcriptional regulator, partial [Candidatus Binatia bacterium]|nr:sigma 54-interacting transcriptional regulator [Candidatus Binatia bacterium]
KVLRALERREFRRLGGTRKIKVDVRLVAATNVELEEAVRTRRFREDLFYRLNVIHIHIPPLRDRREAIAPLAQQFLREFSEKYGKRRRLFSEEALMRLMHYPWPGNVRAEVFPLRTRCNRVSRSSAVKSTRYFFTSPPGSWSLTCTRLYALYSHPSNPE